MSKRLNLKHGNSLMAKAHRVHHSFKKQGGSMKHPSDVDLNDPLTRQVADEMRQAKKEKRKPDFTAIISQYRGRAKSEAMREVMALEPCFERYPDLLQGKQPVLA